METTRWKQIRKKQVSKAFARDTAPMLSCLHALVGSGLSPHRRPEAEAREPVRHGHEPAGAAERKRSCCLGCCPRRITRDTAVWLSEGSGATTVSLPLLWLSPRPPC